VSKQIPVRYWAPLAAVLLALGVLAALNGNLDLAIFAIACEGLLGLSLRLEAIQRRRLALLSTTVALIDAKLDARLKEGRR
jgi:hypothetical protein